MPILRALRLAAPPVIPLAAALAFLLLAGPAGGARLGPGAAPAGDPAGAERLFGFRGYSAVAPENTLEALRAAAAAGVPRAWVEVRSSADGLPLLLADATLDRTTDCTGPVKDRPWAALASCDAGSWFDPAFAGARLPRLEAALAEPGLSYQLFLAELPAATALATVRAAGALDRVTFVTESPTDLAWLRSEAPGAPAWLRVGALSLRAVGEALDAGATGLAVDAGPLPAEALAAAAEAGLALGVVGALDERAAASALRQGAASASTDRLEPVLQALGLAFRNYLPADLGRPAKAQQGFVRGLDRGDFNGDGRADLVLGVPQDDSGGESAGWAGVALGATRFPGPVQGQAGTEAEGQWGSVFAAADFNADGYEDLALGYPLRDFNGSDSGAVWLWDGSAAGVGGLSRPIGSQPSPGSRRGAALAAADFNGDGVPDLAIAAPEQAVSNVAASGQVTLMPGLRGSGPVATGALLLDRTTEQMEPEVQVPGELLRNERLGSALAAGDFDGDRLADLAIGVPGADAGELRAAGSVLVAYGAAAETSGYPALKAVVELRRGSDGVPGQPERNSGFGAALWAADFDADGFDDLVIGAPDATVNGRRGAGELVLMYGAARGLDPARGQAFHQDSPGLPGAAEARVRFGAILAGGDLDGDGRPDLVVGSPEASLDGQPGVGAVTVIPSGAEGLRPRVAMRLAPALALTGFEPQPRQAFGSAVTVADLNQDGAADLGIGTLGYSAGGIADLGALVVAWGPSASLPGVATPTSPPPTPSPPPTLTRTPRPSRTPTIGPSATASRPPPPSATPRPIQPIHLPFAARLKRFPGR